MNSTTDNSDKKTLIHDIYKLRDRGYDPCMRATMNSDIEELQWTLTMQQQQKRKDSYIGLFYDMADLLNKFVSYNTNSIYNEKCDDTIYNLENDLSSTIDPTPSSTKVQTGKKQDINREKTGK